MEKKIKKSRIDSCIFGLLFFSVSLILFWKCRYGYAHLDEAFYPTIAYRFIQGDSILYDEWNNTQLASLLLVPFLKVYIALKGNLDGIYLTIRYGYTVLKMLIALLIYNDVAFRQFLLNLDGGNSINIPKIVRIGLEALHDFRRFKKNM